MVWYALLCRYSYRDDTYIDDESIDGFTDDLKKIIDIINERDISPPKQFIRWCRQLIGHPPTPEEHSIILSDRSKSVKVFQYGLILLGNDFNEQLLSNPKTLHIQSEWTQDKSGRCYRYLSLPNKEESQMCRIFTVSRL